MISVIITFDKVRKELMPLLEKINTQASKHNMNLEVIWIHESDESEDFTDIRCNYYHIPKGKGFAYSRNEGLKHAEGDIIVFIDDDCSPTPNWLSDLLQPFDNPDILAVMGSLKIPESNYIGNCISELGFPAGANAGFENIWKLDEDGFTNHLSTCNCAMRRSLLNKVGNFNNALVYGAEDAELSHRIDKAGYKIKYVQDALVYHDARDSIRSFINWQLRRGKANYYFKQVVGDIGSHLKLRLWSSKNILRKNLFTTKIFGVFPLLFLSFVYQQIGYMREAKRNNE